MPTDISELELSLVSRGWSVFAEEHVPADARRRRTRPEVFAVAICSAEGETYAGEGVTRAEALESAASFAGLSSELQTV